jgi:hypothetical protein
MTSLTIGITMDLLRKKQSQVTNAHPSNTSPSPEQPAPEPGSRASRPDHSRHSFRRERAVPRRPLRNIRCEEATPTALVAYPLLALFHDLLVVRLEVVAVV